MLNFTGYFALNFSICESQNCTKTFKLTLQSGETCYKYMVTNCATGNK